MAIGMITTLQKVSSDQESSLGGMMYDAGSFSFSKDTNTTASPSPERLPSVSCLPERQYIVSPELTPSNSFESETDRDQSVQRPQSKVISTGMSLIDHFSCLCLRMPTTDSPPVVERHQIRQDRKPKVFKKRSPKKKVIYPIATYPARLNSKHLVEQRRRSLEQRNHHKHFFRPVPEDEVC